jgi:phosphodiesterase/alkaline phosphatase D-like protein
MVVILTAMLARHECAHGENGRTLFSPHLDHEPAEQSGERAAEDEADGEPIAEQKIENVVVIGGDIHSFWVTDLKQDFGDSTSPAVATEFVGTSVTSEGVPYDVFNGFLPENPHIKFFESRERGYVLLDVSPELWRTDLRVVDTITEPKATARMLGSWRRSSRAIELR